MNGFCVTDVKNNPSTILGIPVVQIDELDADKDKTLFIIGTMKQKSGGIIRTLEAEGYMRVQQTLQIQLRSPLASCQYIFCIIQAP